MGIKIKHCRASPLPSESANRHLCWCTVRIKQLPGSYTLSLIRRDRFAHSLVQIYLYVLVAALFSRVSPSHATLWLYILIVCIRILVVLFHLPLSCRFRSSVVSSRYSNYYYRAHGVCFVQIAMRAPCWPSNTHFLH